jgi:hypothetical protein
MVGYSIFANGTVMVANSITEALPNREVPTIEPPVRVILRSNPDQLTKTHPLIDQADTELVKRAWAELGIADITNVCRLITKICLEKGQDRAIR